MRADPADARPSKKGHTPTVVAARRKPCPRAPAGIRLGRCEMHQSHPSAHCSGLIPRTAGPSL
eukprot:7052712-Alexandrium_andersonii.AAC.1